MEVPKIDVEEKRLAELLSEMKSGKLQVPRFQRSFVWPLAKTRALLDSMYKEFPIGTFFLWRAPTDTPPMSRPLEELGIPAPRHTSGVAYILDGQQRLASLYVVINGIKLGGRDYGRICIDLETATAFEETVDEGFEESIFVYRLPDNDRYVAVCDLVHPDHLTIYNGIREQWKPAFNKAYHIFNTYPFSVVWVQEQQLGDAIEIFQRINQAGKRLSRYDLVCANVWTKDFDFRKRVADLNRSFQADGFGPLHETIYTQAFALVLRDRCTTAAELSLETDEILAAWDRVVRSLQLAVSFVVNNLGVKRSNYLPYRGILAVLAYYFHQAPTSAISSRERDALWDWFWRVTLSERYGSTSPSRMAEDALKLRELIDGRDVQFDFPFEVTTEAVSRTKMTSTRSALRNGAICMLALRAPKNLKDGSPVNLRDDFFSDLKKPERHHIFPVGYLRSLGVSGAQVHLLPNFCLIPADLNREIGSRAPAQYLAAYQQANPDFATAAVSHLLPVDPDGAVWRNEFQGFLSERASLMASEFNGVVDRKPGEIVTPEVTAVSPVAVRVDGLEVGLRDFIDHRLTAVAGPRYWRRTIPSDVIGAVRTLISDYLSRHPYEGEADYALPRRKLDFCDVSHYEKIILRNWDQFGEFFGRKDELQRHMAAYRLLRNAVQHNREPSDVELQAGEAAMTWIQRILDQYSETARSEDEEEGEELVLDAMLAATGSEPSFGLSPDQPAVLRGSARYPGGGATSQGQSAATGGAPVTDSGDAAALPAPSDLARVLRAGVRNADSLKVTALMRDAVDERLKQLSGGTARNVCPAPQADGKTRVQFLDRLDLGTAGVFPVMRLNPSAIWWGAYLWKGKEDAEKAFVAIRGLSVVGPEWSLEVATGDADIPREVWPGGAFFRAFKTLTPGQLEELETLEELVSEIAADLWWWHQRLKEANLLQ